MNRYLDHRTRIEKVLSGEKPDRLPISFWRHFPVDDQSPEGLARATLTFQKRYDLDFVKVTPSSSFCLKDFGVKDEWNGNTEGTRDYLEPIISDVGDLKKIVKIDPRKGFLGKQLECLNIIKQETPKDTPILQTVFSPLSQLKNLVGKSNLQSYVRLFPDEILKALEVLTEITNYFIAECKKLNIDGIFYAIQQASYDILSEKEYIKFGKSFDMKILSCTNSYWFNILHLHGNNVMFSIVADYPCQVINWHDRDTPPSLKEASSKTEMVLCGGLSRLLTMLLGDERKISREIGDAIEQTDGFRLILSTGCVLPITTPECNISSARTFAEKRLIN